MAVEVPNQESQLQLQLHVLVTSDSKRVGPQSPTHRRPHRSPPSSTTTTTFFSILRQSSQPKGRQTMSRHNGPELDLKLHLSPPRPAESPSRSPTASPPSSCVSSEDGCLRYASSPEATSMMLVGCPRCLMYVMLAEEDPRCPKCKSTVLLDVIHDNSSAIKTKTSRN